MYYTIRPMTLADYDTASSLWDETDGICLDEEDSRDAIEIYLKRNQGLCFVATVEGQLVGTVLCGHEGRRGIMRHLVVAPEFRGKGIGKSLVKECRSALAREEIKKCNTFVLNSNTEGHQFWKHIGWYMVEDNFHLMQIQTTLEKPA